MALNKYTIYSLGKSRAQEQLYHYFLLNYFHEFFVLSVSDYWRHQLPFVWYTSGAGETHNARTITHVTEL